MASLAKWELHFDLCQNKFTEFEIKLRKKNGTKDQVCRIHASRSSVEAEYKSIADTTSELPWLIHLLQDLHIELARCPCVAL